MILGVAVFAGLLLGLLLDRLGRRIWQPPVFRHSWLVAIFFLPQFLAFYLPATRGLFSAQLVAASLVLSQFGLLAFCLFNWRLTGIPVLTVGLFLNLIVILANGGMMPVSPETVSRLVSSETMARLEIGERLGTTKSILLTEEMMVFPWLADRFVPPDWIPYRFAFSVGDVFIGLGAFVLLAFPTRKEFAIKKGNPSYDNQPDIQAANNGGKRRC
jgi:MFS family permease